MYRPKEQIAKRGFKGSETPYKKSGYPGSKSTEDKSRLSISIIQNRYTTLTSSLSSVENNYTTQRTHILSRHNQQPAIYARELVSASLKDHRADLRSQLSFKGLWSTSRLAHVMILFAVQDLCTLCSAVGHGGSNVRRVFSLWYRTASIFSSCFKKLVLISALKLKVSLLHYPRI